LTTGLYPDLLEELITALPRLSSWIFFLPFLPLPSPAAKRGRKGTKKGGGRKKEEKGWREEKKGGRGKGGLARCCWGASLRHASALTLHSLLVGLLFYFTLYCSRLPTFISCDSNP